MRKRKVIVVDDDKDILDAIQIILDDAGYAVMTTSKGEDAYQKVLDFQPDIILLDVLISGTDGRMICRTLKRDSKLMNKTNCYDICTSFCYERFISLWSK